MSEEQKTNEPVEETPMTGVVIDSISAMTVIRTIIIIVAVLFFGYLLIDLFIALRFLLFLVVLSIFFAYLLNPLVKVIQKPFEVRHLEKLMPRPAAIFVSYLIVFSILAISISYLAPLIAAQIGDFVDALPQYASNIQDRIDDLNTSYEQLMITPELQAQLNSYISSFVRNATVTLTSLFVGVYAVNVLTYLPWLLLVPILGFFFLKDAAVFRGMFLSCFPSGSWRARTDALLTDVNTTIAAYTRAQLISCILIGLVCTLGFTLIGLDYPLLLGLLAGILEFIPLLGPLTLGVTATLIGAFSRDPWQAAWTAGFLILLRLTHDYVTYPRIVRDGVHLHPLAIILSILAGEQIAGIAGVFLSIPVVALITVFHKHFLKFSGKKGIFSDMFSNQREAETESPED
jgi:predicted PurR-regulated permease PerM